MRAGVSSISIRFPDGSREFRFPHTRIREGDILIHDGVRYRVISVSDDGKGPEHATVELVADDLLDKLHSEEGAIRLIPFDPADEGI